MSASLSCLLIIATTAAAWPQPLLTDRRAIISSAAAVLPATLFRPLPSHAISATTMTGKTKPSLGVYLVDEVKASSTKQGSSIAAELVLSGGIIATAAFETPWGVAQGGYYDVEAQSRDGETAYVAVASLQRGEKLSTVPKTWFTDNLFSVDGRYGAYGAPIDTKLKEVNKDADDPAAGRSFEVAFTVLSPGMSEIPRKGVLRAIQAPGSTDVLMLLCSSSASRWKGASAEASATANTFRVAATRPTELKPEPQADFRFGKTSGPENMRSRNDGF